MRLRRLALNPGSGSGGGGSGGSGDDFDGAGLESVAAFRAPMSAGLAMSLFTTCSGRPVRPGRNHQRADVVVHRADHLVHAVEMRDE
mmetsp:Transcript_5069/g.13334  ORF Transcript_5069/g.13334 Transcript_5069/m.13334 type:complete len:87 (-) Transcript_5069:189-449(-)